jgi:hypothetical protein
MTIRFAIANNADLIRHHFQSWPFVVDCGLPEKTLVVLLTVVQTLCFPLKVHQLQWWQEVVVRRSSWSKVLTEIN